MDVGSPDPETEWKNFQRTEWERFQRQQAVYEAAYRRTRKKRLALYEAILHAQARRQPMPDWLMEAVGNIVMRGRTDQPDKRLRLRMRHFRRYRCVHDFRQKGNTKEHALDLAVVALATTDVAATRPTIEKSYNRVRRDLKQKKDESAYFYLVLPGEPRRVPVSVTHRSGKVIINGVIFGPSVAQGEVGEVGPAVRGVDFWSQ